MMNNFRKSSSGIWETFKGCGALFLAGMKVLPVIYAKDFSSMLGWAIPPFETRARAIYNRIECFEDRVDDWAISYTQNQSDHNPKFTTPETCSLILGCVFTGCSIAAAPYAALRHVSKDFHHASHHPDSVSHAGGVTYDGKAHLAASARAAGLEYPLPKVA